MKVGVYCGERWWSLRSWKRYPLLRTIKEVGFSIGPILFYRPSGE